MLETSEDKVRLLKEAISYKTKKSPATAAVLSALIPGLGQVYSGDKRKSAGFFLIWAAFIIFDSILQALLAIIHYLQPFHFLPYLIPQEAHIAPRIATATSMATIIMATF